MAEARCRHLWAHTSTLLALLANIHRDPSKKPTPYKPADFNPYLRQADTVAANAPITLLKQVFVDQPPSK